MALKAGNNEEHVDDGEARVSAVEKAWEENETPDDGAGEDAREGSSASDEVDDQEESSGGEDEGGPARDASGRFAKKDGDEGEEAGEGGEPAPGEGDEAAGAEAAADGDGEAALAAGAEAVAAAAANAAAANAENQKRLQAWRPAEREALLKLKGPEGEAVRSAAIRREAQIEAYQRESEGVRRFANEFVSVAEPYKPLFAMLNTTPLRAFQGLMQTAAVLYQGDPRMKAKGIADLMKERGVDPAMVADYLDGQTQDGRPVAQPDPQVQQLMQHVQQLTQRVETQDQANARQAQELADRHVAEWAKDKPWYNDVKRRMALLIKASDEENGNLTLDQAYATAIAMDPEISKLEAQRRTAKTVKAKLAKGEADRRAASSPRGNPTVRARGTSTGDRTSDVENAWDEASGRA